MKKLNVIVFDVDNTLIKGNLTLFFLKFLIKERFYFFHKSFITLLKGAFLFLWKLPIITKNILQKNGNVYLLDRYLSQAIKNFYDSLFSTLKKLDLLENNLEEKAAKMFSKKFFQKHTYPAGIKRIKQHLENTDTVVVLLSGSPQRLLNVFFASICNQLTQEKVDWQRRFFVKGTVLGPRGENIIPCIGSEKNKMLKSLLKQNGYKDYVVTSIYSDNTFMADLPLLIEAKNGGTLICRKNNLYELLPQKLIQRFVFLPSWGEN